MKPEEKQLTSTLTEFLRAHYLTKKNKNEHYSLTAFARDVGLSVSFLSRLLRGQRALTPKQAIQLASALKLTEIQTKNLLAATVQEKSRRKKTSLAPSKIAHSISSIELEKFRLVSRWYHFAILSLTLLNDFKLDEHWIAQRLGISRIEAKDAIERLLQLELLVEDHEGRWVQSKKNIFVESKKPEAAIREFHLQMIKKSEAELKKTKQEEFDARYIAGSMISVNKKSLPKLKERLKQIQLEFSEFANSDEYSDIYQLNLHFFPLTQSLTEKDNKA